jgi:hypothetical protein
VADFAVLPRGVIRCLYEILGWRHAILEPDSDLRENGIGHQGEIKTNAERVSK